MGISLENPHVRTGDANGAIEDVRAQGASAENTRNGRLFLRKNGANLEAHRDRGFTSLVAQGVDATEADVVLAEQGGSGLTLTVFRTTADFGAMVIYIWLCSEEDLRQNADQVSGLQLAGETSLEVPLRQMMREFVTRIAGTFPPPPGIARENAYVGSPVEAGNRGSVSTYSQWLWSLNRFGEWELVGLQNPGDYLEWAIQQALAKAYYRKIRVADESDPFWTKFAAAQDEGDRLWRLVKPMVDIDQDSLPDRTLKTSSLRIRRG